MVYEKNSNPFVCEDDSDEEEEEETEGVDTELTDDEDDFTE